MIIVEQQLQYSSMTQHLSKLTSLGLQSISEVVTPWQIDSVAYKLKPRLFRKVCDTVALC